MSRGTGEGAYETLYELGRGGMGVVELARGKGRLVAVKRILPDLCRDAKTRGLFLREARLLARIAHPNVVHTVAIEAGDEANPPTLVMEYVPGVLLKDVFEAAPEGLPLPLAASLTRDLALALHAAHELRDDAGAPLGVVHRDVSPHNVLVTFGGRAKLLDFGVAKVNDVTRTTTGEVKGKVAYMAPEQALADPVDRRSDIYALGALLYEALTGTRMHGHGTEFEILRRMATVRPSPVADLRADTPPALAALVARLTAESPDARPATAADVALELEPFCAGASERDLAAYLESLFPGAADRHDRRVADAERALEAARVPERPVVIATPALAALRDPTAGRSPWRYALGGVLAVVAALVGSRLLARPAPGGAPTSVAGPAHTPVADSAPLAASSFDAPATRATPSASAPAAAVPSDSAAGHRRPSRDPVRVGGPRTAAPPRATSQPSVRVSDRPFD